MAKAGEEILEQIDHYLNGSMTDEAKALFEEQLAQDASLQDMLQKSVAIREILADYKAVAFKQKFANIVQQDKRTKLLKWGGVIALVLVSAGIGHLLLRSNNVAHAPIHKPTDTLRKAQPTRLEPSQQQPLAMPKKTRVITPKNEPGEQASKSNEQEPAVSAIPSAPEPTSLPKASDETNKEVSVAPHIPPPTNKEPQAFDCSHTMITFATISKPSCRGQQTGQIAIQGEPQGGKGPYIGVIEREGRTYQLGIDFLAEGTYTVMVKDHNGCSTQKTVNVASKTCLKQHEHSFDPSVGNHIELGTASTRATLRIHNKAGTIQYQAEWEQGETITWDGTQNTGTLLPSGVYLYSISEGSELIERGYITIVNTH